VAKLKSREATFLLFVGDLVVGWFFVGWVFWRRPHVQGIEMAEEKVVERFASAEKKVAQSIVNAAEKVVKKPAPPPENSGPSGL
jgi:hypothetical protein